MIRFLDDGENRRVMARLIPLRRRTAIATGLVFAGMGQHYSGQHIRGWIYNALEAGGLITALTGELQRSNYRKDYLLLMGEYDQQINADRIEYYRQEALAAYSDMEDMEQLRNTGLWITGGAVLLGLLDSVIFFPAVETGMGSPIALKNSAGENILPTRDTVHLAYKIKF